VHEVGSTTTCDLLEAMAERMCAAVLDRFQESLSVRLQLMKRPPPVALPIAEAGVEMVRAR
ncbi:MAG: dihydroneopterin aldolase, partial [Chloroflexota bacterium]|nr:dihydroneopterin aldolase [Chloroflexota bacterium]